MSESTKVATLEHLTANQPENPLRPAQVTEYRQEQARLQQMVKAPAWQSGADRGLAAKQRRKIDKMLNDNAPKPVSGPERDKLAKACDEVLEGVIRPSMLTEAEMRRNPSGAVDHFIRREGSKQVKRAIQAWKRGMRALDPENADVDYTNLERFRRNGGYGPGGAASFMADAQLPGNFAFSAQAKENWPLGEPTVDTPLKAAIRREYTPEERQAQIARAANARRAQAEKRAAAKRAENEHAATRAAETAPGPVTIIPGDGTVESFDTDESLEG